jgi:hypothetical protein
MRVVLYVLLLFTSAACFAQDRIRWSSFERLQFEEVYDKESSMWLQVPRWTDKHRELDGKLVEITGYVIALDVLSDDYALSAFPFASCFFCGAAGPESVMELKLKNKEKYLTDEVHTFQGILKLNEGAYTFPLTLLNAKSLSKP